MNDIYFSPIESGSEVFKNFRENVPFDSTSTKKGINVSNILKLAKDSAFEEGTLHEVLEKCEMNLYVVPSPPRNPELEARVIRLKNEQDNAAYRSMTNYLLPKETYNLNIGKEVKSVTSQITAVINFALTVGGSFFFAYKAVEYALPNPNLPAVSGGLSIRRHHQPVLSKSWWALSLQQLLHWQICTFWLVPFDRHCKYIHRCELVKFFESAQYLQNYIVKNMLLIKGIFYGS